MIKFKHLKKCCKNIGYKVVQRGDFLVVFNKSGVEMLQIEINPPYEFITTQEFRYSKGHFEKRELLIAIERDAFEEVPEEIFNEAD